MNMGYGRLRDGQVEYAPDALVSETGVVMNPGEASYLAAGWKKVVGEPPPPEEGCTAAVTAWTEGETTLTAVYKQVPAAEPDGDGQDGGGASGSGAAQLRASGGAEPGRRVFSKLRVVEVLKEAGRWALVKAWLEEMSYYDYYLAAQEFAEDHPLFVAAVAGIREYAHVSEEEAESILSRCVAGEGGSDV